MSFLKHTLTGKLRTTHPVRFGRHGTLHHVQVQPCVIAGQPHIIYPRGLREDAPTLFKELIEHFTTRGYRLKEDQRCQTQAAAHRHERRRWAPIILFVASMLFENSVNAEIVMDLHHPSMHSGQTVEVHLIGNTRVRHEIENQVVPDTQIPVVTDSPAQSGLAAEIYRILHAHYVPQPKDPAYLVADLREIAAYYSEFPEVGRMLKALDGKTWTLKYNPHQWKTIARGNTLRVDAAEIHFDTRAAAQLLLNKKCTDNPVCIASPADALLHELLHAHSMLVHSREFIAQGGMSNVMYPFKHEYAVIDAERKLYARMSERDAVKRPQRNEHTGRTIRASCPTCIR